MKKIKIFMGSIICCFLLFSSCSAQSSWLEQGKDLLNAIGGEERSDLSREDIAAGLKEALHVATGTVVAQLGKTDGFNADPQVHIPLPENLSKARDALNKFGMGSLLDDLELKLNRAAEKATPKAKELFWEAIRQMTWQDVQSIYQGPDDAATSYFREKMNNPLKREMRPIVQDTLAQVGALKTYDRATDSYQNLPFVPDLKADLTNFVLDKGLDGIFHYIAKEEAAIRKNPAKRTTELLRKVFGR